MSQSSKIILIAVGPLAGIVVLATVAALVLRVNAKPRVERVWRSLVSQPGWPLPAGSAPASGAARGGESVSASDPTKDSSHGTATPRRRSGNQTTSSSPIVGSPAPWERCKG